MINRLYIFSAILALLACQSGPSEPNTNEVFSNALETLPDTEAGSIIKKAITRAGGWESWTLKNTFSFYKKITHLDSTGTVEKSVRQHHTYNLHNGFKARLEWNIGDDQYLIINNGEQAKKYKNGIELLDQKSLNEAWNSSFGSHYVIGIPYKLTDPGARLNYLGIDSTTIGRPVHAVKVDYADDAGSTGGMHEWWYFFELDTYDLAANFLDYGEGYSLTTYEVFESVETHRFHNKRYSYISDENRHRLMLRTVYENEEMQFDPPIDANFFEFP